MSQVWIETFRATGVATTTLINGRFLAKPHGGVARVGCELLRALIEEIDQTEPELRLRVAAPPGVDLAGLGQSPRCPTGRGFAGRLGEQLGLPLAYPGATILSFCNVTPMLAWRSVVWIHDAHVFDAPETYPRAYRLWHRAILTAVRLRRFEVATVSNFARDRLIHHGIDPERIRVVHNGGDHIVREAADPSALAQAELAPKRYILVVGSPARHKNVPFAVDALLAHTDPTLKIAVLGLSQSGPYKSAEPLSRDPRVVILPRVDDGQLRALYAAARSVVSPSLIEGFGLYAAEAMFADSGPLVLSNRAALPEVGGDAALYFDPTDPLALAAAMNRALQPDTAAALEAAARVQREKFRWRRAARQIIDTYLR
jgi:glycosyltransferase involved in cell wall biosynthesis